jgi:hypothetical protein
MLPGTVGSMSESYHATVPVSQAQIHEYEQKAGNQEKTILEYLDKLPHYANWIFTCFLLEDEQVLKRGTPHSSYIRAISNLVKKGELVKHGTVIGRYGRPVNVYRRIRA